MRCSNCGAQLEDGVRFCRECGSRVEPERKRFCRECGTPVPEGNKFCPSCGAAFMLNDVDAFEIDDQGRNEDAVETGNLSMDDWQEWTPAAQPKSQRRQKQKAYTSASSFSGRQPSNDGTSKTIVAFALVGLLLFFGVLFMIIENKDSKDETDDGTVQVPAIEAPAVTHDSATTYTIEKGRQYACMTDEWNVYIATAVSDSIIKIENWDKVSSSKKKVEYSHDVGSYKINDSSLDFVWIDDSHTAFAINFQDSKNSHAEKLTQRIFTININDSDKYKGSDYDENIRSFSYKNDDWHMYRAIPLTDTLIKVECWSRVSSSDAFCYGWDWGVIDTKTTKTDFEWTDDEQTSFTITTHDPENSYYWSDSKFVVFEIENESPKFKSVQEFLGLSNVQSSAAPEAESQEESSPAPTSTPAPTPSPTPTPTPEATKKPSLSYTTNDRDTAKKGNSGVFSYRSRGGSYQIYYIIDFDDGYVYTFTDGNGSNTCDRLKIEEGDLNTVLIVTYHDGGDVWSNGLHFKYRNMPDQLVMQDNDGFEYEYVTTNLEDALALRNQKTITDY